MAVTLRPSEQRVLGVLIEKSLSQPAYYPMTLNAIANACNQKTNRDPIMQLSEGEVAAALHSLCQWQLAGQADPDRGSRVNRFRHQVEQRMGWNAAQRAIMAELMLRGPQTLGELRGRASRMTHLGSLDYAAELLDELRQLDRPMVAELPRRPGRNTTRFAHLLGGQDPVHTETAPAEPAPAASHAEAPPTASQSETLTPRIDALEQEVTALRADLDKLRQDLGA